MSGSSSTAIPSLPTLVHSVSHRPEPASDVGLHTLPSHHTRYRPGTSSGGHRPRHESPYALAACLVDNACSPSLQRHTSQTDPCPHILLGNRQCHVLPLISMN